MERENVPVPGPSLEPPTDIELAELAALIVDPAPSKDDGWHMTAEIIATAQAEDPKLTNEAARGRLKRLAADGKIEKVTHKKKNYYRKIK